MSYTPFTPFSTAELPGETATETPQLQHDVHPAEGVQTRVPRPKTATLYIPALVVLMASYRPWTHPRITVGLVFLILGLVLACCGTCSNTMGPAQHKAYAAIQEQVVQLVSQRATLQNTFEQILQELHHTRMQGPWWINRQHRADVNALKANATSVHAEILGKWAQIGALMDAQRSMLGLWSGRGIQGARMMFWYVHTWQPPMHTAFGCPCSMPFFCADDACDIDCSVSSLQL